MSILGLVPELGQLIAFLLMIPIAHILGRRVVFGSHGGFFGELGRFALWMVSYAALAVAGMFVLTRWLGLGYVVANVLLTGMLFVVSLLVQHLLVFRRG